MRDRIDEFIEEITIDSYGDSEQLCSFRRAFEDNARFPFLCRVIGVEVDVTAVDLAGDERRGLVATCRRSDGRHTVSSFDVAPVEYTHSPTWA